MSKVSIKLSDFFRKKSATEDQQTTPPTTETTTDGEGDDADGEGDDGKADGDDSDTIVIPDADETTTADASEDGGDQVVEMTMAEFKQLKADASTYNQVKGELATLKAWKASMDALGLGQAKGDQNTQGRTATKSVMDTEWNQEALKAAGKAD